ncbi:MAG: cell division protein ZapA [bacterium]
MNKVVVEIMGRAYTLSSEEPEEVTREIAGYVDEKIKEIHKGFPSLPQDKLATLASLEIAGELFKTKKRAEKLISAIDSSLGG